MADIATPEEFASFIQANVDTATTNLLLLDLAQGLIVETIGEHDPWPSVAKSIALTAAARAYRNPSGVRQSTVGSTTQIYNDSLYSMGVYLTDDEVARLTAWLDRDTASGQPQGSFPAARAWPDPVEYDTAT